MKQDKTMNSKAGSKKGGSAGGESRGGQRGAPAARDEKKKTCCVSGDRGGHVGPTSEWGRQAPEQHAQHGGEGKARHKAKAFVGIRCNEKETRLFFPSNASKLSPGRSSCGKPVAY